MTEDILQLIHEYKDWFYLITFIWTVLEGETFVIFAGLAAQKGFLDVRLLFLAAATGSMVGDQICYFIGRCYGRKILHHFPKFEPKMDKVLGILERHDVSFILSYRFMYGIRNVSALSIGVSHITWGRFFILNMIASIIWAASFCGAGYFMGDLVDQFGVEEGDIRNTMIGILLLFLLLVGSRIYFGQKNEDEKEVETQGEDSPQEAVKAPNQSEKSS